MKYIAVFAVAFTISSSAPALAGNLAPPIMDQDLIVEDVKAGSSVSPVTFVALTAAILFAVVAN